MKNFTLFSIIFILLGLLGCKKNKEVDFVLEEFKSQLEYEGIKIDSIDESGLMYISRGELSLSISLENVRRNYERDNDVSHISDLVQSIISTSIELPSSWEDAKDSIYISLYPNDFDFKEFINKKITEVFSKVYVYSGDERLTWITKNDLEKWNINEDQLERQANLNADSLLAKTKISIDNIDNHKLGLIELDHTSLKGALLFAPTMKSKIKDDFGLPFYAVIPVRDFCYIFSENDFEFFSTRIGSIVVEEFKNSGYPITTELLKFTENEVKAVGEYPVE